MARDPLDPIPSTHRKLTFTGEARRVPAYASHYRFGEPAGPAPLVVYVGGATTMSTYLERATTEPVLLHDQVAAALATRPVRALDVLICPCPMDTGGQGTEWFFDHLQDELLPALQGPPTGMAFVGYSAGAAYAVRTAILCEARAIALLGSAGVERELRAPDLRRFLERAHADGTWSCDVAIYRNEEDDGVPAAGLAALFPRPLRAIPRPPGAGRHAFQYYVANGSAAGAFRFLVGALTA